jgi:Family of unknown function (DUF5329)
LIVRNLKTSLLLAVWLTACFTSSRLLAQSAPAPEITKIEALIRRVSELQDAKFIRNGSEYDVNVAVKFLRGKWKANDKEVKSARDFIDKVASSSGTSGKPYLIRFRDGREISSRNFLLAELSKQESAQERSSQRTPFTG